MRDKVRRDLLATYVKYGIDDDDDLDFCIQEFIGVTVPKKAYCPNHVSPFSFLADVFFQRSIFTLAFGSRGSGKCLAGKSLVLDTRTGIRHRLDSVVKNRTLPHISSLNTDGEIVSANISGYWDTGFNKCLRFVLASGRNIITTYEHPFMTPEGWKRADELAVDGCVAAPAFMPFPEEEFEIPDAHVDLLAVLLSEGCYTQHTVMFSTADKRIVSIMKKACEYYGDVWVEHRSNYDYALTQGRRKGLNKRKNPIREMLNMYGLGHEKAPRKRIPEVVFRLGRRQLSRFLSVFWMCDGYVTDSQVEIGLSSRHMLEDIQHLLLRFRIQSRVFFNKDHYRLTIYGPCHDLLPNVLFLWGMKAKRLAAIVAKKRTGSDSGRPPLTEDFLNTVRARFLLLNQSKKERHVRNMEICKVLSLSPMAGDRERRFGPSFLKAGGVKSLTRDRLAVLCDIKGIEKAGFETLLSEDIWWDRIVEIQKIPRVRTYDLTVPSTESFIANDIVVHNTFLIEVHNWLKMMFTQTPVEALVAAAALDQANRGYNYFTGFFRNEPILTKYLSGDPQKALTRLTNGSSLQIVYGTRKGLNGPHTQLVSIDEVELIDYPVLEQGLAISMSKGKVAAQDILSSTRKTSVGTMSRLLEEAEEKNLAISNFCVWESVEKCTRLCFDDPVHGDCPIEDKCKGRAHDCDGWYKIDDFITKARNLSKTMFSTEFENNDPSGEVKVYGEYYDESRHVISMLDGGRFKTFQQIFQLKEIPRNWRRVAGMDFGAHFAYVQFAIEPRYDIWILEREYYFHGDRLLARHAKEVLEIQAEAWKVSTENAKRRKMFIFSDPSAKQEILEMKVYGLNCVNAMNDLVTGVDEVKKRLTVSQVNNLPKLLILDHCVETRREFRTWAHPTMPDGKPNLDAFEDGNDHCFVAGTLIETDHGSVPIEAVKVGDLVLTRKGFRQVLHLWSNDVKQVYSLPVYLLESQKEIATLIGTANHPIACIGNGWIRLGNVKSPMHIPSMQSLKVRLGLLSPQKNELGMVLGPASYAGQREVFNLTVADVPEYFANGVLVHNCLDATRYGIFTFPRMPRAHVKPVTVSGI